MYVVDEGSGPALLLVHGSAADADAWSIQRAALAHEFRLLSYDRRGTPRSPLPAGASRWQVGDHADDAVALIEARDAAPAIAVGSSFGGVIALELARRRPELLRGIVLCEPPLAPTDDAPATPDAFRAELERRYRDEGGPAAAEFFLRTVLGDEAFAKMPARWRERACGLHEQIRLDTEALLAYRPRYHEMGAVTTPVLLLGGGRSAGYFAPTLAALEAALPNATRRTLRGAGHMMHAEAARAFNDAVRDFSAGPARRF